MNSRNGHAQKPPEYVQIRANDYRLIIENYNRALKAQAQVPVLKETIDTLESARRQLQAAVVRRDSSIADQKVQVNSLLQVHANDLTIIQNERAIAGTWRTKARKRGWKIAGLVVVALAEGYLLVKK